MKKDFSRNVPELRAVVVLGALEHLEELYVLNPETCLFLITLLVSEASAVRPPRAPRRRAERRAPCEHARAARHLLQ